MTGPFYNLGNTGKIAIDRNPVNHFDFTHRKSLG